MRKRKSRYGDTKEMDMTLDDFSYVVYNCMFTCSCFATSLDHVSSAVIS